MGVMAGPEVDRATAEIGERVLREIEALYQRIAWAPIPGRQLSLITDGAIQAVVSASMDRHIAARIPPDGIVDALAHAVAIIIFQQTDVEDYLDDFQKRVIDFGLEFAQDSAAGNA